MRKRKVKDSETLACLGHIEIEVVTQTSQGDIVERQQVKNLVVDQGLNTLRNLACGNLTAFVTHLGVGSGTTAVAANQTNLASAIGRLPITEYVTSTNKQCQFKTYIGGGDFNASPAHVFREIGLFTAATGTTLFARALLASPITKNNTTTVTITWTHTLSAT